MAGVVYYQNYMKYVNMWLCWSHSGSMYEYYRYQNSCELFW